jgi:hypothetical protein
MICLGGPSRANIPSLRTGYFSWRLLATPAPDSCLRGRCRAPHLASPAPALALADRLITGTGGGGALKLSW